MNKRKKFISTICSALIVCFSMFFVSCGKSNSDPSNDTPINVPSVSELVTVEVSNYQELKSAVKGNADIVKLISDIDIRSESMNPNDFFVFERKMTLDLNGMKIFSTKNIYNEITGNVAMLEISENANVTITGNGKIVSNTGDAYAVHVTNGGKLSILNGEFVGNRCCIMVDNGSLDIRGGNYRIEQVEYYQTPDPETNLLGFGFLIDCNDLNIQNCSIVIKGGEFINFNPQKNISNGINTNYLVSGYKSVLQPESTELNKIYRVGVNN